MFDGEVEVDESYFGGRRKGKRGRGAAGKNAVFGLLKRNGKVYTVAVPNCADGNFAADYFESRLNSAALFIRITTRAMTYWL